MLVKAAVEACGRWTLATHLVLLSYMFVFSCDMITPQNEFDIRSPLRARLFSRTLNYVSFNPPQLSHRSQCQLSDTKYETQLKGSTADIGYRCICICTRICVCWIDPRMRVYVCSCNCPLIFNSGPDNTLYTR
ncbi:hypothetical protein SARC_00879, partial [Sphaeroforma arctica JP610]